eukprot:TRINITY_DN5617_c0_g1_i1.p1 TRINITY_DN5617_c0_g1~~TRINITY_DN5617_c0_g1_i1.p1  ORF type:complete len:722 (+),score=150.40 TRINITY_DN5617_c0_g1_i1:190-2355(+)
MGKCSWFWDDENMPDRDRVAMTQWKKWTKYHRFPFKAIVHLLITAALIVQIYYVSSQLTEYTRGNRGSFSAFFFPEVTYDPERPYLQEHALYTTKDAFDAFNLVVSNYYNLGSIAMCDYQYLQEKVNGTVYDVKRPVMTLTQFDSSSKDLESKYFLTEEFSLGPFQGKSDDEIRELFSMTSDIKISLSLLDDEYLPLVGRSRFQWDIDVSYAVAGGGLIPSISIQKSLPSGDTLLQSKMSWIPIVVLVLTAISTALNVKAMFMACIVYFRSKAKYDAIPPRKLNDFFHTSGIVPKCLQWSDIPLSVRAKFFINWNLMSLIGDGFLISYGVLALFLDEGSPTSDTTRLLLGGAIFIQATSFTRYLEYNSKFYTLILTLKVSLPNIMRFTLSVAPFYMAYALCGIVLFSPFTSRFYSLDQTSVTLFALLNGDDIHATFDDLSENYPMPWVSRIFLYSFVVLFITTILNIFIFIIENNYHVAKVLSLQNSKERGSDSIMGDPEALLMWQELKKVFSMETLFDLIDEHHSKSQSSWTPLIVPKEDRDRRKKLKQRNLSKSQSHQPSPNSLSPTKTSRDGRSKQRQSRSKSPAGKNSLSLSFQKSNRQRETEQEKDIYASSVPLASINDFPRRDLPASPVSSTSTMYRLNEERAAALARAHPASLHALDIIRSSQDKFLVDLNNSVTQAQAKFLADLEGELASMVDGDLFDFESEDDEDVSGYGAV